METYELFLNEDINKGVFAISLVNDPAMESNWVTLSKNVKLAVVDEEKQILMGVAMIPNKPIPREEGESVFFSEKTVRQASELFFKNGFHTTATLEHSVNLKDTTVVESWIKEDEVNDKSVKFGIEAPLGSWIISMKVEDSELFKMAKDGIIKGFSIEGGFSNMLVKNKKQNKMEITKQAVIDWIKGEKKEPETIELSKHEAKVKELNTSITDQKQDYEDKIVELGKEIDTLTNDKTTLEDDKKELETKNVELQSDLDKKPDAKKVIHSPEGKIEVQLTKTGRIMAAIKNNKNG